MFLWFENGLWYEIRHKFCTLISLLFVRQGLRLPKTELFCLAAGSVSWCLCHRCWPEAAKTCPSGAAQHRRTRVSGKNITRMGRILKLGKMPRKQQTNNHSIKQQFSNHGCYGVFGDFFAFSEWVGEFQSTDVSKTRQVSIAWPFCVWCVLLTFAFLRCPAGLLWMWAPCPCDCSKLEEKWKPPAQPGQVAEINNFFSKISQNQSFWSP